MRKTLFTDDTRDALQENAEARWKATLHQYEQTIRTYLVRENVKPTKTALRKLRKNPDGIARKLGLNHIGAFQSTIDKMLDDTMTMKDWKRELAKLQGQQAGAHSSAMREVPGGQAMGRKTSRDRGMAWRHNKMKSIEKKIASMESEGAPAKALFTEGERNELQEAASWKRQTITIPLRGGEERKVKASVLGVWAVSKGVNGWSVTHVPSGALLASWVDTMKQAKAGVAEMIKTTPNLLNMKQSEVHARYDELQKWTKRIEGN